MADDKTDAPKEQKQQEDSRPKPGGGKGRIFVIALAVGTVAVAAGAGVGLRVVLGGGGGDRPAEPKEPEVPEVEDSGEYEYYIFDPITVNADVPRRDRFIRATIRLAIDVERAGKVIPQIEKQKPELENLLTVYLSGLTLEDTKDLNRIREEICTKLNRKLWPSHPGQIHHVLVKDFAVQ